MNIWSLKCFIKQESKGLTSKKEEEEEEQEEGEKGDTGHVPETV